MGPTYKWNGGRGRTEKGGRKRGEEEGKGMEEKGGDRRGHASDILA